jgi:hypothetical protein
VIEGKGKKGIWRRGLESEYGKVEGLERRQRQKESEGVEMGLEFVKGGLGGYYGWYRTCREGY